ncbi:MAG TPA: ATP-grasp domain-containing protein [Chthoniobacterales bacterium]|nr:ATP-grasp domain-containing protein [Chthoniobacterales bacterium]
MSSSLTTTILVTGVGDTVGQALVKAARQCALPSRVIGTDRDPNSVGLQWVDAGYTLPHCANAQEYVTEMTRVCACEGVQLILPGSEKELVLLSEHAARLQADCGAIVVASRPAVLRVAMDKWETCRFLERAGFNFPRYAQADDGDALGRLIDEVGFPLIAKPIRGTGARGMVHVRSRNDLAQVHAAGVPMVVQELLEPAEEEYSVEVYTLKNDRQLGSVCYRRDQLIAGDTYKARIMPQPRAEAEARGVVAALGASGPCNVQLRVTERGPVTFEINPRFSGGVSMRAHFGFNEVEMAIRDLVLDEPVPQPKLSTGLALRFWEEMYVKDAPAGVFTTREPAEPLAAAL